MFNVLIVDDEKSNREGLKYLIEWELYDFEVIDTARNGIEALEKIKKLPIDLVIVDIQMPVMNGLELIEEARKMGYSQLEFIILSGYAEFEYAKEAIALKAKSYLLKPIDEDELCEILRETSKEFKEKRKQGIRDKQILLHRLWEGRHISELEREQLFNKEGYRYIYIELEESDGYKSNEIEEVIENILQEEMGDCILLKNDNIWSLFVRDDLLEENVDILKKLYKVLEMHSKGKVSLLVGSRIEETGELNKLKQEINHYKAVSFYKGEGEPISYDQVANFKLNNSYNELKEISTLIKYIESNNKEEIEREIDEIIEHLRSNKYTLQIVETYTNEIVIGLTNLLGQYDIEKEKSNLWKGLLLGDFSKMVSLSRYKEVLKNMCNDVGIELYNVKYNNSLGAIGDVVKYVNEHYNDNLNLKDLANMFYMNASYLGQLFKKTMGIHFKSYLQTLRIEESKRLLKSSNLRVYEIANKVGYEDANYFVVKFEETQGMSPSTYRKNHSR